MVPQITLIATRRRPQATPPNKESQVANSPRSRRTSEQNKKTRRQSAPKPLLFLLFALTATTSVRASAAAPGAAQPVRDDLLQAYRSSVVHLQHDTGQATAFCFGRTVREDELLVLTAAHCVKGAGLKLVTRAGRVLDDVELIAADQAYDLALLLVRTDVRLPILPLAPEDYRPMRWLPVAVMGYPGGSYRASKGFVLSGSTTVDRQGRHDGWLLVDADTESGASGAPIVTSTSDGASLAVIGLHSGGGSDSLSSGANLQQLYQFLRRVESRPSVDPDSESTNVVQGSKP